MGDDSFDAESDEVEEILPPSWDADNDAKEGWNRLFEDSDSSNDFHCF